MLTSRLFSFIEMVNAIGEEKKKRKGKMFPFVRLNGFNTLINTLTSSDKC